jgi:hypothetical protein
MGDVGEREHEVRPERGDQQRESAGVGSSGAGDDRGRPAIEHGQTVDDLLSDRRRVRTGR